MHQDLLYAKDMLFGGNYTCVFCRGNALFTDDRRGIRPLLELIDRKIDLQNFSVADKVVGKAAALLYCHVGICRVYAPIISRPALEILEQNGIFVQFEAAVPAIRNRDDTDLCPMEKAVWHITDPAQAVCAVRAALSELQK